MTYLFTITNPDLQHIEESCYEYQFKITTYSHMSCKFAHFNTKRNGRKHSNCME